MAIATRTLKDTVLESSSGAQGGKVTILVNMDDNTTANSNILDASGLSGHANGAKLDITRVWWQLVQGTADDNTGHVQIQFKGASSDTTATSGDLELSAFGTSGSVIIELRKDENFTA